MELKPKRQPGRADRKAATYALEIVRLRGAGYTYAAIREAMAEVGIELSTSALRREVRRLCGGSSSAPCDSQPLPRSTAAMTACSASGASAPPCPAASPGSRGREVAEAFFSAHPSNPLVRTQEIP